MHARSAVFLLLLLAVLWPVLAAADVYVISDFETAGDLAQWEAIGAVVHCPDGWCEPTPATLSRVTDHATSGSYSCRAEMPAPPTSFPGMNLISFPITDWSPYDVLRIDCYNPNSFALVLHVELSDSIEGSSWSKRYYTGRTLVPGANSIEIDLHDLPRNDDTGDVDTEYINRFLLYGSGFSTQTDMYYDYVRLETVTDDPWADAARDIYKFDFGTTVSPRWPDFFRVTASDTYPVPGGTWGWTGGDARYDADLGGPDYLCRDCVRHDIWGSGLQMDFGLDLPNDTYGVYLVARSGEWHGMPVRGWQVWAEGTLRLDVPMDASTFYSDDYYYRGKTDDYPLGMSYWDRYVAPNFPAYEGTVVVSDGRLDLSFVDCWAYMLIVYPTSLSAEMSSRIAAWEADREAQFESTHYVNEPESLTFTPTGEESARGYAAWPVPTLDPCYPDTLPPDPRPALALSAQAAQGECRAVSLAIRPLANVSDVWVEVSDLSDGAGHTIAAAAVESRYVRYLPTPSSEFAALVVSWKPHLLQADFPIGVPEQVTKQFWLEVTVPEGAAGGSYTGTVTVHASAGDLVVPLTLTVWPFQLDPADDMSYGWYYMSPDERYCFKDFPALPTAGDDMLRLDFADMREHGFNAVQFPTPICWPVNWSTGWVETLDMSELDRYVAAMSDTDFGGLWKGQVGTLSIANQILRHSTVSEFDANFNASFKDVLARMVSWGDSDGVPLVMYLVDEPRETEIQPWNRNLADTLSYCGLANDVSGVVSTVTVMSDSNGGLDYTVIADETDVIQTHPWDNSAGLIGKGVSQEKPIWLYNTWDNDMWSQHRWGDLRLVYGFYQYKVGDGAWEWHFDWLDGDVWDPFPYAPFNNHWHFTYPSPDGPVPTLKYKFASQGIADYRYTATLARLADEARAAGRTAYADQADALLASLLADLPEYPVDSAEYFAGLTPGPDYMADLEAALDGYRADMAQLILQGLHGDDTIGLLDPAKSRFYLRNSNTTGVADVTVSFGPGGSGWLPIIGDWDGDGVDTIGLFDPARSRFYLRNSNTSGVADVTVSFGPGGSGWAPLVGDWDGDGTDTIGLFDPVRSRFYLRNSNTTGVADITVSFGPGGSGWTPVIGDWNGDGTDTIGLFNPALSKFYLRNSNTTGVADLTVSFGPGGSGWTPLTGDWDSDGTDTIGLFDPSRSRFYLRNSNTSGVADIAVSFGPAGSGWTPLTGDWDGL